MEKIQALGNTSFLEKNAAYLEELGITLSSNGRPVTFTKSEEQVLKVEKGATSQITYCKEAHIIRGLLRFLTLPEGKSFEEVVNFKRMGPMIDLSRNGVLKVSAFKKFIEKQARLGFDTCMLYMEDVYEVPEYPYFGYLRGRYSLKELKELDDFAFQLGIELIPSIQTLGHLINPLKWGFSRGMKDTADILLVGEEKTYTFIEALIKNMAETFRSKKIHIGMDEAWTLGSGVYLQKNGYHTQFEIMTQHLNRVIPLVKSYGLEPMIWSDMYFRAVSKTGDYYDEAVEFTPEMIQQVPDMELTLWDYYNTDQAFVEDLLKKHFQLANKVSFAGGIWTWNGFAPNYGKAIETTQAGLAACRTMGVSEIYATMWGDDGQETSVETAWFGLALYAQYQFAKTPSVKGAKEDMLALLQEDPEEYLLLSKFDEIPGISQNNLGGATPSKSLFYQDLFLKMLELNLQDLKVKDYYQKLLPEIQGIKNPAPVFDFYKKYAEVLVLKAGLASDLQAAYDQKDVSAMEKIRERIQTVKEKLQVAKVAHYTAWSNTYQPFGWEVFDIRYGGMLSRLETILTVLTTWVEDPQVAIPELEAEILPYDTGGFYGKDPIGNAFYQNIVTASKISGV